MGKNKEIKLTKRCSTCKQEKPLSEFWKDRTNKDGYCKKCKDCKRAYRKTDTYKKYEKAYRQLEKNKQYQKDYAKKRKYYVGTDYYIKKSANWRKSLSGKYSAFKRSAKKRNIIFTLTKEDLEQYWTQSCFYCGSKIETIGLDRIDSSKGYELDNVVPCCTSCNYMKHVLTQEEFDRKIVQIYNYRKLSSLNEKPTD